MKAKLTHSEVNVFSEGAQKSGVNVSADVEHSRISVIEIKDTQGTKKENLPAKPIEQSDESSDANKQGRIAAISVHNSNISRSTIKHMLTATQTRV